MAEEDGRMVSRRPGTDEIVIRLRNIRELLVAPEFDPFSEYETEYMGKSAISRLITQLKPGWSRDAGTVHLVIMLPGDQITADLTGQVSTAIRRFCQTKMEDNRMLLKNIRWNGIRQIPFGFAFLAGCIFLGTLFGSGLVPVPPAAGTVLNEGFYIIGWVSLWGPTETLLFDPLPVKRENKILQVLMDIPVEIRPSDKIP